MSLVAGLVGGAPGEGLPGPGVAQARCRLGAVSAVTHAPCFCCFHAQQRRLSYVLAGAAAGALATYRHDLTQLQFDLADQGCE